MKPWQTTTPSRLDPLLNPRPVSPPPVTLGMDAIAVLASRSTTGILLTTGRCAGILVAAFCSTGILAAGFAGFEAARSFSTAAAKEALVAGMPTLRSFAWHVNSAQRIYAWIGRSLSCCPGCFDSFLLLTFKQLETAGNERIQIIIVLHSTCWAMFAPGQSGLWIRVDQNPGLGLASCLRCGRNKAIRCVHRFDVNRQQRTPILTWQYRPCSHSFQVNNSQHLFGEMCWKNTLQNFRLISCLQKSFLCFLPPTSLGWIFSQQQIREVVEPIPMALRGTTWPLIQQFKGDPTSWPGGIWKKITRDGCFSVEN